jgi:hypothetical protein
MKNHLRVCLGKRLAPIFLLIAIIFGSSTANSTEDGKESSWIPLEEIYLPPHVLSVMDRHFPLVDMAPSENGGLWFLTREALWFAHFESKTFTHISLIQESASAHPLKKLAAYGSFIFAANSQHLFQIIWPDRRVFRYQFPKVTSGTVLDFSIWQDELNIIHTDGLLKFTPHEKKLQFVKSLPKLREEDFVRYNPQSQKLWRTRGKILEQADLSSPDIHFSMLLKTHNPILDLFIEGMRAVAHTAFSVLNLGPNGKITRSIPVEGRRRLLSMYLTQNVHAYIFNDHLIEIYNPEKRSFMRSKIDIQPQVKIKKMIVVQPLIYIMTEKKLQIFKLADKTL